MVSGRAAVATSPERLAAQSMANLAELRSLGVRESQAPIQLGLQDPVFSSQIFVPQQQLLVHSPSDVGKDARPLHKSSLCARQSAMGALDRPKKPSGRPAARLRQDGITTRISCSFNFLTIRAIVNTIVVPTAQAVLGPASSSEAERDARRLIHRLQ